ncbi:ABC transporter ATP-binding protein [Nesterenkonia xinjiangensis]|uniref:Spermidine/putrescine import ATP-binding protein PotA n=1 Tax=Nesterenkonia xinjiangensis TaxID=225327 RepID=A0A7Z0K9X0_9MICC|nr:ABC transporter ATP-binding protein [Nesterenkonia xinjiangensis]NYJ78198.1 putative spermidine/putrescine transport system ATP-binding protein [Nesterenkonia xinjiangensis]
MTVLQLKGLTKKYGDFTAVEDVDLSIEAGEFITLLGPSGSGKTTILQMIAGFHLPTAGSIELNGRDISSVPPSKRNMGFVFQDYALFPHMTVFQNIAYPLKIRKRSRKEIRKAVEETMALVQLQDFAQRKPSELSGGQQQRVALARALVFQPELILMDEPLGALDKNLRAHVQLEIKRIQEVTGVTIIFVTHDQEEALVMSDRIAVLNNSRLVQFDTPERLYESPNSHFVANFIGENNFIPATVAGSTVEGVVVRSVQGRTITVLAAADRQAPELVPAEGDSVRLSVRPEALFMDPGPAVDGQLQGTVATKIYLGDSLKYIVRLSGPAEAGEDGEQVELNVVAPNDTAVEEGQEVAVYWKDATALRLITS